MIEQTMSRVDAIEFGNIRAFSDVQDPRHWYFIPFRCDLQRNENGVALISLFELGSSAQLTFSTLWQAGADDLAALTNLLERARLGIPDLQLGFAPIGSPRCRILVADGAGGFCAIGTSETSGYPPFQTLFNLALTGSELAHARAALRGERGHLFIEYTAQMPALQQAEARLSVDTELLLGWLAAQGAGAQVPAELLEQAIAQGLIRVENASELPQSRHLRQHLIEAAARLLPIWLSSHDAGLFELSLAGPAARSAPLCITTDLGALLAPALS